MFERFFFFLQTRQQAKALKLIQTCKAKEQGGRDEEEGDGGRLQTDPFVDFPKHCIL